MVSEWQLLEIIQVRSYSGRREKRLWDLHELLRSHDLSQMLDLHEQRYPYSHDKDLIIKTLHPLNKLMKILTNLL
jgi:hypothetical protein